MGCRMRWVIFVRSTCKKRIKLFLSKGIKIPLCCGVSSKGKGF